MRRACWRPPRPERVVNQRRRGGCAPAGFACSRPVRLLRPPAQWSVAMAGPRRGKRDDSVRKGARILIVEARFYDDIADALLAGAMKALADARAAFDCISVPGSLEIPTAITIALDAAQRRRRPYDGA